MTKTIIRTNNDGTAALWTEETDGFLTLCDSNTTEPVFADNLDEAVTLWDKAVGNA